jgi:Ca2+-binding RTX toxin-like protein
VTNIQSVIGTTGNDTFISGNGIKEFWGSGGNDTLIGSVPSGIFFRGTFADYSSVTISLLVGFDVRAFVDGALIIDDVRVSKILLGSGDDLVRAPAFQTVDAGEGDDIVEGAPGHNILNGGAGNDTIDYSLQRSSLSVDLSTGKADGAKPMGNDDLNGFENAYAGSGDDTLIGDAIANVLRGGDGQDMLSGGAGNDTIEGGSGYDTVSFASEASPVVVDLAAGIADGASSGHDVLVGVEFAIGTTGDDHLTGTTDAGYSKLDG